MSGCFPIAVRKAFSHSAIQHLHSDWNQKGDTHMGASELCRELYFSLTPRFQRGDSRTHSHRQPLQRFSWGDKARMRPTHIDTLVFNCINVGPKVDFPGLDNL